MIQKRYWVRLDQDGKLEIPPAVAERFGLQPGEQTILEENGRELILYRPVTFLERVYVEVTNVCNLQCRTCVRNVWDEAAGFMNEETFEWLLEGVKTFYPRPTLFFGGYGEPLAHPRIFEMIAEARALGAEVEIITNGTLLKESACRVLLDSGVNLLWVSLDGATPQGYMDVRLGDALDQILSHLRRFHQLRQKSGTATQLGIAFVAMRRNIHELPRLIELGREFGAAYFSISNVLAHTHDLRVESLYDFAQYESEAQKNSLLPVINLPRADFPPEVQQALAAAIHDGVHVEISGLKPLRTGNRCPFIEKGSLSVRWDGKVSPCLPLLHTHESYLDDHLRRSAAYFCGDLSTQSLSAIWRDPVYLELRQRLMTFDFAPCVVCNACEMAEENKEDCFGNQQPACGGCLWAQGLIQCP
ncbi:MAG: tungsten cofactor oxidoreductase radical SAM maturase [Bellilinea sp.]|nr:MAG: tungsten cofactor oxidoreductase radical SAM maturase [Bellilinea sp.]